MDCYQSATIRAMRTSGRDCHEQVMFYTLISTIAAEEGGHIVIVAPGISSRLKRPRSGFDD